MRRYQILGGIALLVLAALIFLILQTSSSIAIAITLAVVGIALVATSKRK